MHNARRQAEEEDRAQLLARTDANGAAGWRAGLLDDDAQSMNYVQNSKRVLEEAFQTGTAILTNMSGQRERLKACLPSRPAESDLVSSGLETCVS